jgi:glucosamine 6-phosphate synthetase-like amidotransferase/phosphosugar isomerase protein
MCGIAGILLSKVKNRETKQLCELFTANLIANEIRGKDATGILVVQNDCSWFLEKAPLPASIFTTTAAYKKLLSRVNQNTTLILGHTRKPTKGSPENNNNNHPIVRGHTIGVHNGTLSNDNEIFLNHLKAGKESRIGAVDSEAIFALIDELPRDIPMREQCDALSRMSELLHGSYTTIYLHPENPNRLYLLKYNNPMSVHYSPGLQSLFFSSRYIFLRKAFGRSVITEALPSRSGYIFDAEEIQKNGKNPFLTFSLSIQSDIVKDEE